ncbi:MAG: ATP-binding protein [Bacteriovorax sp.]|nr:ATP-binding protein [Bacteriovorax sp.]
MRHHKYSNHVYVKNPEIFIIRVAEGVSFLKRGGDPSCILRERCSNLTYSPQLVRTDESLYYWREGSDEVDFVLKNGRKLYAIEVKSGRKKSQKGLEKFKEKFPEAKLILITLDNYKEFESGPMQFLENC